MARSHAVWVVVGIASSRPVATFTVKHELVTWMKDRIQPRLFRYFRHVDGCPRRWDHDLGRYEHIDPVEFTVDQLLS